MNKTEYIIHRSLNDRIVVKGRRMQGGNLLIRIDQKGVSAHSQLHLTATQARDVKSWLGKPGGGDRVIAPSPNAGVSTMARWVESDSVVIETTYTVLQTSNRLRLSPYMASDLRVFLAEVLDLSDNVFQGS